MAIIDNENTYQAIFDMTRGQSIWLAGSDAEMDGKWHWIDDNNVKMEFDFSKWKTSDEARQGGDCLRQGSGGNWRAWECAEMHLALCQLPQRGNFFLDAFLVTDHCSFC